MYGHHGKDGEPICKSKLPAIKKRIAELQRELNPFSDSVTVTWDRGLIVGVEVGPNTVREADNWVWTGMLPFREHPICTIRLRDWHGIERSLPKNPAEALPWVFKLELPQSTWPEVWEGNERHENWEGTNKIVKAFGTLPNGKPCVGCDGKRGGYIPARAGYTQEWVKCHTCKGTGQGSKPRVRVEFYDNSSPRRHASPDYQLR